MHLWNRVCSPKNQTRANKALWFIRINLWRCPKSVKQQMYFALVRPHLEFTCAVWDPYTTSDIQKLEGIQRRTAWFVAKDYRRTDGMVTNILQELQWPSLEQRRQQIRLSIMYKIHHQAIAIPIPDYIHRQTAQTGQYHPQRFRIMKANSNIYKYTYFPPTITKWNSLPTSVYDFMTVECFKNCIKNV